MRLDTSIEYIKGVGPAKADLLRKELGIFSCLQLLQHYPFRYIDRTKFTTIQQIYNEEPVQLKGVLLSLKTIGDRRKKRLIGQFRDGSGVVELVWFKGIQWVSKLETGVEYVLYGKPNRFNGKVNFVHPELERSGSAQQKAQFLSGVYHSTEKLSSKGLDAKGMRRILMALFSKLHKQQNAVPENIPGYLLDELSLLGRYQSLLQIHFPTSQQQVQAANKRIVFEEFFFMQLRMLKNKMQVKAGVQGLRFEKIGDYFNNFYHQHLSFGLTQAQKRVIKEIRADMGSGLQMNRLLQGDVGSGKTIVAFMNMLIALDNDFQAAIMAPTEILANQHLSSIEAMANPLGIKVALLTGSIKGKKRETLLEDLKNGTIQILIGTHALIEPTVVFQNLGIVVVDEQHRFGVVQRAKMWMKNKEAPPHILVMTATPIPRTLAMTAYGDLDVSVIDEMPPGRIPVKTFHKFESQRLWVFGRMKEAISKGHQVYIVYPLIEESEYEGLSEVKDLMVGYEAIEREFPKPQYQISVVHGRQRSEDKDAEMVRFAKGETQILMATTVIEVGVNVPNATLMVIENAERFGLAQLHQLRGRVGRGGGEANCILMTDYKLSKDGKFRMEIMCQTTDGFKISEADLKLRGPGNIEGTQQSGILNFKLADIVKDTHLLQMARQTALTILQEDPSLSLQKNKLLREYLATTATKKGFGRIS